jgi:hypothetical protein
MDDGVLDREGTFDERISRSFPPEIADVGRALECGSAARTGGALGHFEDCP